MFMAPESSNKGCVMFEPRDPEYDARVRRSFAAQSFMVLLGARIGHLMPGEVDLVCERRDDLLQQHGYFHAGVMSSIADSAAGYAALSLFEPGHGVLTTEYKINLVAPGAGGRLVARGRVIKPGRTLTTCKSDVFSVSDEGEKLVATGLFTMMQIAGLEG
jgi:uncharacterized protein (TIGR00369 family)